MSLTANGNKKIAFYDKIRIIVSYFLLQKSKERNNLAKGKLIVIESGTDASGKATQTQLLYNRLAEENYRVRKISFPDYDSESSSLVKMYLRGDFGHDPNDVNGYITSTFFAVDRFASFTTKWGDFYNSGGIIICDRYTTSNMVHQGAKLEAEEKDKFLDWLADLEFNLYGLPTPDKVFFLNVPPTLSNELMKNRLNKITGQKEKDIHENDSDYLIKSYNHSLYVAEKYNWVNIQCINNNTLRPIQDIHEEIYNQLKQIL